jgi:hypothetical protein
MNLSQFNGTITKFAWPVLVTLKTAAVGAGGAALAGGATAATQYVQTNGATQNWQAVGSAAAAGAVAAAISYFLKPPHQTP